MVQIRKGLCKLCFTNFSFTSHLRHYALSHSLLPNFAIFYRHGFGLQTLLTLWHWHLHVLWLQIIPMDRPLRWTHWYHLWVCTCSFNTRWLSTSHSQHGANWLLFSSLLLLLCIPLVINYVSLCCPPMLPRAWAAIFIFRHWMVQGHLYHYPPLERQGNEGHPYRMPRFPAAMHTRPSWEQNEDCFFFFMGSQVAG